MRTRDERISPFILPPSQVIADRSELLVYEVDGGLDRGSPDLVLMPERADEVARIVRWAASQRKPVVARGAGTGLSGGAVAERGGIIVEYSRMNRVLDFDVAGRMVTVEPGLINLTLDSLAKSKGLYYPPDPASGRSATLGGNIAENSGGPHCFKYGVTANYVTGLEVVLADGRQVRLGGRAFDYPEYDLTALLCGSEGTLGLITAAHLRLIANPPAVKTMMAAFPSVEAAGEAVSAVIAAGLVPATLEMMDQQIMRIINQFTTARLPEEAGAALIVEADGYPASVDPQIAEIEAILRAHGGFDLRVARTAEERETIWYGRKSAVGAMTRLAPAYYLVDVTVPRSKLAPMLAGVNQICAELGLRVGYVFHAGDGNLHPLILIENPRDRALMERVHLAGRRIVELGVSFDGSITGEHGVGIEKREYMPLMYSHDELAVMRDVKEVFDPAELLNPGKIFPAEVPPQPPVSHVEPALPASGVLQPASPAEAAAALRATCRRGRPVVISGAAEPPPPPAGRFVLSTAALRGITTLARDDLYVQAGAGTPLAELQAELAPLGMWVPAVAPYAGATIGGLVATNINAPLRMRYGAWRDLVLAATLALPDGRLIRVGRPVVKNVAGYDLPKLIVGAHGTLGLICDLTLKLAPLPRARASLAVPVRDLEQGLALGSRLAPSLVAASALLLGDAAALGLPEVDAPYALLYTAEGLAPDVSAELALVRDALSGQGAAPLELNGESGSERWAAWMGAALAADEPLVRLGVPPSALPDLLRAASATPGGLLADVPGGLLYLRGTNAWEGLATLAQRLGGYGVALAGAPAREAGRWRHTPQALDLMRALKARWNPGDCLNPGAFLV
ncbi:MAG: FAD-linked oxidase C-terminal domain-containing protein [Oscillochloridaceae bacterium]|nr:FAD-binding oxidoreductase [Chloroflexaceae bacterium]MDW8391865.1 FAD-linked oxidase C-terminal domain-containing protein [Oscillochloridaceae bacterium]